jgi:hypothetical protein
VETLPIHFHYRWTKANAHWATADLSLVGPAGDVSLSLLPTLHRVHNMQPGTTQSYKIVQGSEPGATNYVPGVYPEAHVVLRALTAWSQKPLPNVATGTLVLPEAM